MPEDYRVRRANSDDINKISDLIHLGNVEWFGDERRKDGPKKQLFQNYQTHRLIAEKKQKNTAVAYAEYRNFPDIAALPSDGWLEWLHGRFCITYPISTMNTLFLNYCVYGVKHSRTVLSLLLEVFYIENRLSYVIVVRMPSVSSVNDYYAETFTEIELYSKVFYPKEYSINNSNTQMLYIVHRYHLLPRIIYRKCLPEDNDDLVEIHSNEFPQLLAELGEFYIAEELLRTDEDAKSNCLIVAELENEQKELATAGFFWLESDVNIRFYVTNYEMDIFGNLINCDPNKPYKFEDLSVLYVEPKAEAYLFTADAMDDLEGTTILGGVQRVDSGMSVASVSKFRVSSIRGTIVDSNSSSTKNKFYSAELLYLKFTRIFERIYTINYYTNQQLKIVKLCYNEDTKTLKSHEDGVQNASNVFALKYICVEKMFPLERLFNFLCAMFSAFPDRDYCIMVMPKRNFSLPSHLEALKYFMPVSKRPSIVSNLDDVYITHRSTMYGEISLYSLRAQDVASIEAMALESSIEMDNRVLSHNSSFSYSSKVNAFVNIENEAKVLVQIMKDVLANPQTEFNVFTIRCGNSTQPAHKNTTIGYVVLRRFFQHDELLGRYHLPWDDNHLNDHRAEIISLKLHPLFHNSCDAIFRNLASKTNYFDFYFFSDRMKHMFTNDLKTSMMLVEPNMTTQFVYNTPKPDREKSETIHGLPSHDYRHASLIVFRHKLNPSKFYGNANQLVIIGFTPETKAFLREMIFLWNTKDHKNSESYTCLSRLQVTVIARPGIVQADYDCMFRCPFCKNFINCFLYYQHHPCFIRDVVTRMDLRYWVHFVSGHVNYINREKKYVKINQSCEIFYDTLLLMNSIHYDLRIPASIVDKSRKPYNLIELNYRLDRFILFYKVRVLLEDKKRAYRVLIYGDNLATYECVAFLLSHGISANRIVLVKPPRERILEPEISYTNPQQDEKIEDVLHDILVDLDIKIHNDLSFVSWVQHSSSNFIVEVVFSNSRREIIIIDCDIFISFKKGYMDYQVTKWLIKSKIDIKNGRVLVNTNYQTNDPDIYAMGKFILINEPVTYQYCYTNLHETARKLLHILGLRPTERAYEDKYAEPALFRVLLPLNYFITKLTKPRRYLRSLLETLSLTTYHNQTFCRITFSPKMIVEEIVVVTKELLNLDYLQHFCGKHESLLNNLKSHYNSGHIQCILKFLQEPWTELVTHKYFEDYQAENHNLLRPLLQLQRPSKDEKILIEVNKHIMEQNLLDFVRQHRREFHYEFALPEDFNTDNKNLDKKSCKLAVNKSNRKTKFTDD